MNGPHHKRHDDESEDTQVLLRRFCKIDLGTLSGPCRSSHEGRICVDLTSVSELGNIDEILGGNTLEFFAPPTWIATQTGLRQAAYSVITLFLLTSGTTPPTTPLMEA